MLTGIFEKLTRIESLKKYHIPLIHDLITMKEFESLFFYWGLKICKFDSDANNIDWAMSQISLIQLDHSLSKQLMSLTSVKKCYE